MGWEKRESGLLIPVGVSDPEPEQPRGWVCFEGESLWCIQILETGEIVDVPITEAQRLIAQGEATTNIGTRMEFL